MRRFLNITRALADENRVRVLMALGSGELCACEIIDLLGLSPSTVSKHMSILVQADFVEYRKDGRWHYYRLAPSNRPTLAWMSGMLKNEKQLGQDRNTLKKICRKYANSKRDCC